MKKAQREKLQELANYPMAFFTFPREGDKKPTDAQYIPLTTGIYLRQLARDVLALEKK